MVPRPTKKAGRNNKQYLSPREGGFGAVGGARAIFRNRKRKKKGKADDAEG